MDSIRNYDLTAMESHRSNVCLGELRWSHLPCFGNHRSPEMQKAHITIEAFNPCFEAAVKNEKP
jgi:hypothetical protein